MKAANAALINFLLTAESFARCDLYTITLSGGSVVRYTSADQPTFANGYSFQLGPPVSDGGVTTQRGTDASSVDITFFADNTHQINGVQFLDFVDSFGFDGATIQIDRAYAASWSDMALLGPIGTYKRFYGRFSETKDLSQTQVVITASSWPDLLSVNVPQDCFQTSCLNVLGDSKCQVNVSAYAKSAAVTGATTSTSFGSTLAASSSYFALGKVIFSTGANAGLSRTVKSQDGSGNIALTAPLASAPSDGDVFAIYPGCDLSLSTCSAKFNNLIRFRGQPFIPIPSTVVGGK